MADISAQYKSNRTEFNAIARQWTLKHAILKVNKENDHNEKVDENVSEKSKRINGNKPISGNSQSSCGISCSGSKRLSIESSKDGNLGLPSNGKKLKLSLKAVHRQTSE